MSITLDQVTKHYGGVPVVNDVSLDIGDGEFFVLLGPSGSGKSTLLRAIAGLTGVDHGRIALHGRDVTHVAARKRGVGLVFQNYALFRHMTVAENIEFALRVRHVRARERRRRRQELLRLVALEGLDQRLPAQLSGGQQQRVAVARALAHKPEVLLLDEPFGALDAKIREELRRTIRQVQRELGITTVLVTHDQEEAFAMADRIGIMNHGRLLEMGAPHDLYSRPATRFVATFLGAANLLLARRTPDGIQMGVSTVAAAERSPDLGEHEVVAVVRPEEVELAASRDALKSGYLARGVVDEVMFSGALESLRVRLANGAQAPLLAHANGAAGASLQVTRTQPEQRGFEVRPGQEVAIGVRRVHVLPTPLSSFTACAVSAALAEALSRQPLLAELAARMHTRIARRVEPRSEEHTSELQSRVDLVCRLLQRRLKLSPYTTLFRSARLRGAPRAGGRNRRPPCARSADTALELHGVRGERRARRGAQPPAAARGAGGAHAYADCAARRAAPRRAGRTQRDRRAERRRHGDRRRQRLLAPRRVAVAPRRARGPGVAGAAGRAAASADSLDGRCVAQRDARGVGERAAPRRRRSGLRGHLPRGARRRATPWPQGAARCALGGAARPRTRDAHRAALRGRRLRAGAAPCRGAGADADRGLE